MDTSTIASLVVHSASVYSSFVRCEYGQRIESTCNGRVNISNSFNWIYKNRRVSYKNSVSYKYQNFSIFKLCKNAKNF